MKEQKRVVAILSFEWDEQKNEANIRKHGISFELALHVFDDENRLEEYDWEHSDKEDRYLSIGMAGGILTVIHTDREDAIRIISARPADRKERMRYYGQFSSDFLS